MKKRIFAALLTLALTLSLAACGSTTTSTAPQSSAPAETTSLASEATPEATPTGAKPTADRAGNAIEVPDEVNTIVSMTPATTQVLIDLGLTSKLVGIDVDSAWMFPEMADVAAFDTYNPDLEQLLVLAPDVVFAAELNTGGEGNPFATLQEQGVCVPYIPTANSLAEIYEDVRFIAACVGEAEKGEALVGETQAVVAEVSALAAGVDEQKSVYIEISALPYIYVAGDGVFLNEIIELVGGVNALAGNTGWLPLTEEAAVEANPDVILTTVNYLDEPAQQEILARDGWENVTAVANGDVYYIDNAAASLPNHHVKEAIVEIAKLVYPDVYAEL